MIIEKELRNLLLKNMKRMIIIEIKLNNGFQYFEIIKKGNMKFQIML